MRNHPHELSTAVILSGAKDLTEALLITLGEQRDGSSLGEVHHFVRDDLRSTRRGVLFTTCR